MSNPICRMAALAATVCAFSANSAFAGGLADAIVEQQPQVVAQSQQNRLPGWVIPVAALVLLGAVVASSDGGDDEPEAQANETDPFLDVK